MKTPTMQPMRNEPEQQAAAHEDVAISVKNLSKTYRIFGHPGDRIKQALTFGQIHFHREFAALKEVSFDIKKGETVGIIGRNGSGKSTLLQLICGILKPTSGTVTVNGRVSALLELGAGFNPEFTGRENVYFQGAITGIPKEEMAARFDDIAAFADIGEFIDQPVRTYSSGMFVRLAFAVAVHVDPEILIVDEALSVGDIAFQRKCMQRMQEMLQAGCTLIFVSHDVGAIKSLCQKALMLVEGSLRSYGDSGEICNDYIRSELIKPRGDMPVPSHTAEHRRGGAGNAAILAVEVDCSPALTCTYGGNICVRIRYKAHLALQRMVVSFYIKDARQLDVLGTNTEYEGIRIGPLLANEIGCVEFCFRNPLRGGTYGITAILADTASNTQHFYDWIDHACYFESHDEPGQTRWAIACPEIRTTLRSMSGVEGEE